MPIDNVPLLAFNRGLISELALCRTDIKRTAMSAEIQSNWMSRVLGSTMLRPGLGYIDMVRDNLLSVHIPFIYASDDTALIELTDNVMRVRIEDELIARTAVATTVQNGDFAAATGWTDNDESGATSTISGNKLSLLGTGFSRAIRTQNVSVALGDRPLEHALRIDVEVGPVTLRVGTASGTDDLIGEAVLGTGSHSLAFTPNAANFYIQFSSARQFTASVTQCQIEAAGVMELESPWEEDILYSVRWEQSADVLYVGAPLHRQRKIERRGTGRSWSIVEYLSEDGPFRNINLSKTTLTPSATTGDITLTASQPIFSADSVGTQYKISSVGQRVVASITGGNQWSSPIRIVSRGETALDYRYEVTGTWTGTVRIQRSLAQPGNWTNDSAFTGNAASDTYTGLTTNQIVYYRIGMDTGDYGSGTAQVQLSSQNGSIDGTVIVTGYTNATTVTARVLKELGGVSPSENWYEGEWSPRRGFPVPPALYEGRLFWAGKTKIIGSVSDSYESFDSAVDGDSAPINRSIGRGPIDDVFWLLPLQRLCLGTASSEWVIRSSSFDEVLTAANFNLKDPSSQGSEDVPAIKVDSKGFFVSGNKLFQLIYSGDQMFDYESVDMMELCPEVGRPGIQRIAVQRRPDTRIHCVRTDGKVAILVSQPAEEVLCWLLFETDGFVEDAFVLPRKEEDQVYYVVRREVDGQTVRYLEKWAMESECDGAAINKQADCFVVYDDVATTTITGLDHLEGREVIVWADGIDMGTTVVESGSITLDVEVSQAVIGLYYEARFKSTKLAYAAALSTALGQTKCIDHLGLIMSKVHHKGIKYGKSFAVEDLEDLPDVINDIPVEMNTVFDSLDTGMFEFKGEWDVDSRLCLVAAAPRPATLLAAIVGMKTNG